MNNIELIDKLTTITTLQADIIREQAYIIEQNNLIDNFENAKETVDELFNQAEYELRHFL